MSYIRICCSSPENSRILSDRRRKLGIRQDRSAVQEFRDGGGPPSSFCVAATHLPSDDKPTWLIDDDRTVTDPRNRVNPRNSISSQEQHQLPGTASNPRNDNRS
jgi:hypothetical protein